MLVFEDYSEELDKIFDICTYELKGNERTEMDKLPGSLKPYKKILDSVNNIFDIVRESRMGDN
jgi:hypothetical protein